MQVVVVGYVVGWSKDSCKQKFALAIENNDDVAWLGRGASQASCGANILTLLCAIAIPLPIQASKQKVTVAIRTEHFK